MDEKPKRKRRAPAKKKTEDVVDAQAPAKEKPVKSDDKKPSKAANDEASLEEPAEKPKAKRAPRKKVAKKTEKVSVDTKEAEAEPKKVAAVSAPARDYEVVNPDTGKKKKGWWNRLTD